MTADRAAERLKEGLGDRLSERPTGRLAMAASAMRTPRRLVARADASPYLDRRPPVAALAPTILVAVVVFTMAGLLWVRQANSVADTGREIARALDARDALLMRRAAARVALAEATDPLRLAERAHALGFAEVDEDAVEVVTVITNGDATISDPLASPGRRSPLELVVPPAAIAAPEAEPSLSTIPLSLWQALEDGP